LEKVGSLYNKVQTVSQALLRLPFKPCPHLLTFSKRHLEKVFQGYCREANRIVVEYAMSRTMSPVMVAQYKRLLIPKEVLERTFEEYLSLPDLSQEK
jgi:hypothetical protein